MNKRGDPEGEDLEQLQCDFATFYKNWKKSTESFVRNREAIQFSDDRRSW